MKDFAVLLAPSEPPVRIAFDMLDEMTRTGWIRKGDDSSDTRLFARRPAMDLTVRIDLHSNMREVSISHRIGGELIGRFTMPKGDRRDLLVDDDGIDALMADLARPAITSMNRPPLEASEIEAAVETCTLIQRIASAAVSMAQLPKLSLPFLTLPNAWNPIAMNAWGGNDSFFDATTLRRIEELGATLPHFVRIDQNDVSDDPEMRYDIVFGRHSVLVETCPPIEAMRILAQHA